MTPFEFIELVGATWYIAYVLTNSRGPLGIFENLREFKVGRWHGRSLRPTAIIIENGKGRTENEIQHDGLLDCIICLSIWIALGLCLLSQHTVLDAFAVAGLAMLLHSFAGWRVNY